MDKNTLYLGVPLVLGKKKIQYFQFIVNKFWKRVENWMNKNLCKAEKLVMIKVVLKKLPPHLMSYLKLPAFVIKQFSRTISSFRWDSKNNSHKLHWVSWQDMCKSKPEGGLGIRDFTLFNQALLASQCWKIITNPESLVAKFFKSIYFPNSSLH